MLLGAADAGVRTIWLCNATAFVLLVVLTVNALRSRRPSEDAYAAWYGVFLERLEGLPSVDELWEALGPLLSRDAAIAASSGPDRNARFIAGLDAESRAHADAISELCLKAVNSINPAAELIDEGLVRVHDIARRDSALHRTLLVQCRLVEPVIWLNWLHGGRGRWALRLVQLADALDNLRADSWDDAIREPIVVNGYPVAPRCAGWPRLVQRVRNWLRPPTIDRATKIEMLRRRDELVRRLGGAASGARQW